MSRLTDFITTIGNPGNVPVTTTLAASGEAITAGDIVTLGADNLAYWANDPLAVSASLRPVSAIAAVYDGLQTPVITASPTIVSSVTAYGIELFQSAVLSNGNLVIAWIDGNTSALKWAVYAPSGGAPIASGATSAVTSLPRVALAALTGGGFVIVQNAANIVKFTIYNNAGAVVTAITNAEPTYSTQVNAFSVKPLSTGGFVIAWNCTAASYATPRYAVFSAVGAIVKAAATLNATTSSSTNPHCIDVDVLIGGGFAIAYVVNGANTYFQVFNNAGTQTVAETLVAAINGNAYVAALTGGGFALYGISLAVYIYNAAGVLQVGAVTVPNYTNMVGTALTDGGFAFVGITGTTISASKITAAGALVSTFTITTTAGSGNSYLGSLGLSNGTLAISWVGAASLMLSQVDAAWSTFRTATASTQIPKYTSSGKMPMCQLTNPSKPTAITYAVLCDTQTSASLNLGIYNQFVQAQTPVGIATANALSGAPVQVQITGSYPLRLTFAQPYNINAQNYATPGQKMSIVGNVAGMNGTQASVVSRNIN